MGELCTNCIKNQQKQVEGQQQGKQNTEKISQMYPKNKQQIIHKNQNTNKYEQYTNNPEIEQLISKRYDQTDQCLILMGCATQWQQVINYRNWYYLRQLNLYNCKITDDSLPALTTQSWPQLSKLWLCSNQITGLAIAQLVPMKWDNLLVLNIFDNNIGSKGSKFLSKVYTPSLQTLIVEYCRLGSEGIRHLIKRRCWKLDQLFVNENDLGIEGFEAMSDIDFSNLTELQLSNCSKHSRLIFDEPISVLTLMATKLKKIKTKIKIKSKEVEKDIMKVLGLREIKEIKW